MKQKYRNEDFFKIIGRISLFCSTLDFIITHFIYEFIRKNPNIKIDEIPRLKKEKVRNRLTLGQKIRIFKKLIGYIKIKKIKKEFNKIYPELKNITSERNHYIHDLWEFKEENIIQGKIRRLTLTFPSSVNSKPWIKIEPKILNINDLYFFLKKVGNMQKVLGSFCKEILKKREIKLERK